LAEVASQALQFSPVFWKEFRNTSALWEHASNEVYPLALFSGKKSSGKSSMRMMPVHPLDRYSRDSDTEHFERRTFS
jgi:hypothetical protein